MSTTPLADGAPPSAVTPEAGGAETAPVVKLPISSVPEDIRRRVLGDRRALNPTPEELAERQKAVDAEAKRKADEAAAAAAAAAAPVEPPTKIKKVAKQGPPLPETPPPAVPDLKTAVRDALAEEGRNNAPAKPKLSAEAERELELARHAEKAGGGAYTGFSDKLVTFFSSHEELINAKAKELGGANSGEFKDYLQSDEYKGWLEQNRPSYARGDKSRFQESLIAEKTRAEVKKELAPELKKLERKTREVEVAPELRRRTGEVASIIISDSRPEAERDPALAEFAKDPTKFGEQFPEEAQLIAQTAQEHMLLAEEVYRVDKDLTDLDENNPRQQEIRKFMARANQSMQTTNPNGLVMPDGKILIDAWTYGERGLNKDPRYRTWTADEMIGMIAAEGNAKVIARLAKRREGVSKSIYARPAAPVSSAPAQTPPIEEREESSPQAVGTRPRSAPGKVTESKSLSRRYG